MNVLHVKLDPSMLSGLKASDLLLLDNLAFIIENLRDCFKRLQKYRIPLLFPGNPKPEPISFFPENTESQNDAVETAIHSGFSYIWGVPGCGKTRNVLANCAVHYLSKNRRVLLVAPTNCALDSALDAVMKPLDRCEIPHSSVLRLGNPSAEFEKTHRDICEDLPAMKEYAEAKEKLSFLKLDPTKNKDKITRLEAVVDRLHERQTFVCLLKVHFVAATADVFSSRLTSGNSLHYFYFPEHIFLDEAAYCPLIKALPPVLRRRYNHNARRSRAAAAHLRNGRRFHS